MSTLCLSIPMCCGRCLHRLPCACSRRSRACERPWRRVSPLCATREILRAGADWIKLATSGGVLSAADAPTSSQLTIEEIAAAVYEAAAQEKRCMAHAQGTMGIQNALVAGVASIEHGIYLTDELIDLMLEKDAYLVPTLVAPLAVIKFSQDHPDLLPAMMALKALSVVEAHQKSFRKAVEAGGKIAMGTG